LAEALSPFAKRESTARAGALAVATVPTPATGVGRETPKRETLGTSKAIGAGVAGMLADRRKLAVGGAIAMSVAVAVIFVTRGNHRGAQLGEPGSSVAATSVVAPMSGTVRVVPSVSAAPAAPSAPVLEPLNMPAVRSLSEQSEHSSDKARAPSPPVLSPRRAHKAPAAVAVGPSKSADLPTPSKAIGSQKRPERGVSIDQGNPY